MWKLKIILDIPVSKIKGKSIKKIIHNIFNGRWITQKDDTNNRIIVNIYEKNRKVYGKVYQFGEDTNNKILKYGSF